MRELPVWEARQAVLEGICRNQVYVIVGETGSGKTTQIPKFLHQSRFKKDKIICTQPRRVAAIANATRVAKEMGCKLGGLVGSRASPYARFTLKYADAYQCCVPHPELRTHMYRFISQWEGDACMGSPRPPGIRPAQSVALGMPHLFMILDDKIAFCHSKQRLCRRLHTSS